MNFNISKYKLALSILFIYFLGFTINTLVPLISDDFSYMHMGLDLSSRYQHYITWSGRLVADMISSTILQLDSIIFRSLINTIPLVVLCYFIYKIVSLYSESDPLITPIIAFSCYFIFNPNLGQTTFWIVGSANYLWTTTFCVVFTYSICILTSMDKVSKRNEILIYLSAILAGCSSEASAALMVSVSTLALLYNQFVTSKNKRITIISVTLCLFGFLILISAPGNQVRLASEVFSTWREMGLIEKLEYHFVERVPNLIRYIKFELAISLICFSCFFVKNKFKFTVSTFYLFIAPLMGFSFIILILTFSPYTPERTVNILAAILAIPICALINNLTKWVKNTISFLIVIIMLINWYYVYFSYSRVYIQDTMRRAYIKEMITSGVYDIQIPLYNFSNFFKMLDLWDLFSNEYEIARYFGARKVTVVPVNIDFSYLTTQPSYICKINDGTQEEKEYSFNFYVDSFNDVLLIGETNSSKGTIDGLTQVNVSIDIKNEVHTYELPSNNVNIFGRNLTVVRTPSVGIDKAKQITFFINGTKCTAKIDR